MVFIIYGISIENIAVNHHCVYNIDLTLMVKSLVCFPTSLFVLKSISWPFDAKDSQHCFGKVGEIWS